MLLLSFAMPLFAVDFDDEELLDLYGEEETLSISTGTNKPIRLAPSVASVITQEEIENSGAQTLEQVLESVPGLHVSLSAGNLLNPVYSIRGIHTSQNAQVLLLLDGAPIRQLFTGGRPALFHLSTHNIKRVEVIRGPGSAVYGADAFAGVVNVVTKGVTETGPLKIGASVGSFNSREIWLQAGKELDSGWRLSANFEHSRSDGDDSRVVDQDFQTLLDSVFSVNASNAPGALATGYETNSLRLNAANEAFNIAFYTWQQVSAGTGAGGAQALDPIGSVEGDYYLLDMVYKGRITEDWRYEVKLDVSYYDLQQHLVLLPPGSTAPIGQDGNLGLTGTPTLFVDGVIGKPGGSEQRQSLEFVSYFSGVEEHKIRGSFGFISQDGDAHETKNYGPGVLTGSEGVVTGRLTNVTGTEYIYVEPRKADIKFLSIQDEWSFASDWEMTAGLRYDNYSDFGDTLNPRLALVWATTYNLTSKLLYGRAFRAPSVSELFSINNPVILGNPNLEPEIIDTIEVAFDFRPSVNKDFKLNLFYYDIRDLIEFVAAPDLAVGTRRAENSGGQEGYGLEFEFSMALSDQLTFKGNYAWQNSEDKKNKDAVADAPENQVYLALDWKVGNGWIFNTKGRWIADRSRSSGSNIEKIDDYTIVDLTLRNQTLFHNTSLSIIAKNIFDEDAFEPRELAGVRGDYPLTGRSIALEIEYSFVD